MPALSLGEIVLLVLLTTACIGWWLAASDVREREDKAEQQQREYRNQLYDAAKAYAAERVNLYRRVGARFERIGGNLDKRKRTRCRTTGASGNSASVAGSDNGIGNGSGANWP